jgi:hypothetical protein
LGRRIDRPAPLWQIAVRRAPDGEMPRIGRDNEQMTDHAEAPERTEVEQRPPALTPHRGVVPMPTEIGGPKGPEPTRYGDWERNGRCIDF